MEERIPVNVKGFSDSRKIYDNRFDSFMSDEFDVHITNLQEKLKDNIINKIIIRRVDS